MFTAKWTGSYPCLCSGEWVVEYNGKRIELPENRISENMNTSGTYSSWHFEDWEEVFEDYEDGLDFECWINENSEWVNTIFDEYCIDKTEEEYKSLFESFQASDWRHGSCGGCI